jgi:hypothetical protein
MLKGDLMTTPLAPLLLELADDAATGCLHISGPAGEEALVYLRSGLIYSVSVPGTRPQLGAKLVSSGALAPEALAEALDAQRTELQGWRLGELLVHLGYVDQPVVEAFVKEQANEALWDLLRWRDGRWKFRKNVKAREDVGPPMTVVELLESLRDRGYEWETISAVVHGPTAIPKLSTRGGGNTETTLDSDAWSMLCKIDGERSVADLARDCGYTLFEAGHVIVSLVRAGLVDINEDIDVAGSELYGATTLSSAFAGELDDFDDDEADADGEAPAGDALARLARMVTAGVAEHGGVDANSSGDGMADEPGSAGGSDVDVVAPGQRTSEDQRGLPLVVGLHRHSTESFAASLARVSSALSEVLGDAPAQSDLEPRPVGSRRRSTTSTSDPEWQRRKRLRAAAAAELATAQALIETLRPGRDGAITGGAEFDGEVPKVVSRASERRQAAAREAEETERRAAADQAKAAADEAARRDAEAAARAAEEQARAEQEAAEAQAHAAAEAAEAERLRAEIEAAEAVAWQEYWHREEEVRRAAQEAARVEAERLEAERVAAAEAARIEAERVAAHEAARLEAERVAAEEAARLEAERVEAERIAAEEAQRIEAERVAAEEAQRIEAERVAAEEAARREAERAEAERIAAEEAARVEAERIAAEEAQRIEVERVAAEEAARREAERAEAERIAAEEAARVEAERVAAEQARKEAEREAERAAAAEATRREDQAAAATALLVELATTTEPSTSKQEATAAVDGDDADEPAAAEAPTAVDDRQSWNDAGMADTAALLRELSSLSDDDDREPRGPTTTRPPRTTSTDKKVKKKIGLFGL